METEQIAALSERTPSAEELEESRFPSFELDFSHEQLEHLEESTRGVVFYGGAGPSAAAGGDVDKGVQPARGNTDQPSGPLYQRQYHSASVLVCNIPVRSRPRRDDALSNIVRADCGAGKSARRPRRRSVTS